MTVMTCPTCANTTRWRNALMGRSGTFATCKVCFDFVEEPDITSDMTVRIADTDSTTFGNFDVQNNLFL